jgi:hypothetical protein
MYRINKNINLILISLMFLGALSLTYGFFQGRMHLTESEISKVISDHITENKVKINMNTDSIHHDNSNYSENKSHHKHNIHSSHEVSQEQLDLIKYVENYFKIKFTNSEKIHAKNLEHIIHITEHALHAKSQRPWSSLLTATLLFFGASLLTIFFLALQYVAEVGWSVILKRVFMAIGSFLPYSAIFLLIIFTTSHFHLFGNHTYHWMAEGIMNPESNNYDKIIAGKEAYLNFPFFILRFLIFFLVWIFLFNKLKNLSLEEDLKGGNNYYFSSRKFSAIFIVFLGVSSSMLSWDWIMSIDTHWFSTLFGWYVTSSMFVTAMLMILFFTMHLKNNGYLEHVNTSHIHDIGKFIFGFSIFWTYLWFAQFLLIWYANIPEEVTYYMARFDDYKIPFFTAFVLNFLFPILLLVSRYSKRIPGFLTFVSVFILLGHYLDFFVMIMPGTVGSHWNIGIVEVGTFLGMGGLFTKVILNSLSKINLVPKNHPMIEESKNFHI